jgi:predicted O-methyltransferase YrrM
MAAALAPDASFITVEPDEERYRQARETLAGSRAEVVNVGGKTFFSSVAPSI